MKSVRSLAFGLVLAAGLGACQEEAAPAAQITAAAPAPAVPPAPPEPPPPPYVGLWAAGADLCTSGAWVFDRDRVVTAGEVACEFQQVTGTNSGFQVTAACSHEGETKPYQFNLTLTDPAPPRSMTVSRGPWNGPITLMRCSD
jgi:hypothetical protein